MVMAMVILATLMTTSLSQRPNSAMPSRSLVSKYPQASDDGKSMDLLLR